MKKSPLPPARICLSRFFAAAFNTSIFLSAIICAHATTNPVGGGLLDSGLQGEYFNNNNLSGTPAFTRRDIRIDFDWGDKMKPGGGMSGSNLASIGADNYSIRWQGSFMPRFSETYTIKAYGDSVRVWIKPASSSSFPGTAQINYWPGSEPSSYAAKTATYAMTAGVKYDIKIEYRERTGPAMMRLLWSSPSTPEEVIQPTAYVGERPPDEDIAAANVVWGGTNWGEAYVNNSADPRKNQILERDARGWPTEDFSFLIRPQNEDLNPGTYLLQFKGRAKVFIRLVSGVIFYVYDDSQNLVERVGGISPGEGYDAGTNTTTALVVIPPGAHNCWPTFQSTDRGGDGSSNTGVTDIRLMRPTVNGGTTPHDVSESFNLEAIDAMDLFTGYRWNDVNCTGDSNWGARTGLLGSFVGVDNGNVNHEYKILWCNRTGRDLWLQIPHQADDEYVRNLARLLRYGSDQDGIPYASAQAAPYHPPLNPNLRVTLEYSNECPWNGAGQYPQANWVKSHAQQAVINGTADGAILNYDGIGSSASFDLGKRYVALRIKQVSDIFRSIWGDDAMPAPGKRDPKVRPVQMYQYNNYSDTAYDELTFLDNYFNKTDPNSTFDGTPRPVNYYLYGAGAACYYASDNRLGIVKLEPFASDMASYIGGFQTIDIPDGQAVVAPVGSGWAFAGTGGIYHQAARSAATPGSLGSSTSEVDANDLRGCMFTVGGKNVAVYELGRMAVAGNTGEHEISIYRADTNAEVCSVTVNLFEDNNGDGINDIAPGSFVYGRTGQTIFLASKKTYGRPYILQAGQSYYLVSKESGGGDAHYTGATMAPPAGLSIDGTVKGYTDTAGVFHPTADGTANRAFGPVNLKIATQTIKTADGNLDLGFLQDSKEDRADKMRSNNAEDYSTQAMFLAGDASAEAPVTFGAPGTYGLIYHLAYKPDQDPYVDGPDKESDTTDDFNPNPPKVFLTDSEGNILYDISPRGQGDTRLGGSWDYNGYWTKPNIGFDFFGSAPFDVSAADAGKTFKIRFVTDDPSNDAANVVMIDNVVVASQEAMSSGEIPVNGTAEGQPKTSDWEAGVMNQYVYAQTFGLHACSYEGGWYPGGDANKMPLQSQTAYHSDYVRDGEIKACQALARAGLAMHMDYTREFVLPEYDLANASGYARYKAISAIASTLPAEATNGLPMASTLAASSAWWKSESASQTLTAGNWLSWNVIATRMADYRVEVDTGGSGSFEVFLDELPLLSGTAGTSAQGETSTAAPSGLTKGLHALRIRATEGSVILNRISIAEGGQAYGLTGLVGAVGDGIAQIRWPAQAGVDGYNVYLKKSSDSVWAKYNSAVLVSSTADTPVYLENLQNGETYSVVVTTVTGGAESAFSNAVTLTPAAGNPSLSWEFDDGDKAEGQPATFCQPGLLSSGLRTGPANEIVNNNTSKIDAFSIRDIENKTFDENRFIEFSIQAKDGYRMSLSAIKASLFAISGFDYKIRVSTDGFATFDELVCAPPSPLLKSKINGTNVGTLVTGDLSGLPALQRAGNSTVVTFRIYIWNLTSSNVSPASQGGVGKNGADQWDLGIVGAVERDGPVIPATLMEWEFDDSINKIAGSLPPSTQDGNIASGATVDKGGGFALGTNSYFNSDAVGTSLNHPTSASLSEAVAKSDYISWRFRPAGGSAVSLSQLVVGLFYQYKTNTFHWEIRASTDPGNFDATAITIAATPDGQVGRTGTGLNTSAGVPVTADLSGISALQNLGDSKTVEFRVYLWGGERYQGMGIGKLGNTVADLRLEGWVSVAAPAPTAVDDSASVLENGSVNIPVLSNDSGQNLVVAALSTPLFGTAEVVGNRVLYTPLPGVRGVTDKFIYRARSGSATDTGTVTVTISEDPALGGHLAAISWSGAGALTTADGWVGTGPLGFSYTNPVAIATVAAENGQPPVTAMVRRSSGADQLEVRLIQPTASVDPDAAYDVSLLVVEAGVYDGWEAGVASSTTTDNSGSWVGQQVLFQNTYTQPIVLGQVMVPAGTDPGWSVFWTCARNGNGTVNRTEPATGIGAIIGKHVGEDPSMTRPDAVLGYLVLEAGPLMIDRTAAYAAQTPDSVVERENPVDFDLTEAGFSTISAAFTGQSEMDGADGGWAGLVNPDAISGEFISLGILEDELGDADHEHVDETVGVLIFGEQ